MLRAHETLISKFFERRSKEDECSNLYAVREHTYMTSTWQGGRGVKNLDSKLRMVEDGRWGEGGGSKGKIWTSTSDFYFCQRKI